MRPDRQVPVHRRGFRLFLSRAVLTILLSVVCVEAPFAQTNPAAAEPEPGSAAFKAAWLEDFAQLRRAMALQYANLDWAVERRGMDLPALVAETERKLELAGTVAEARAALTSFVRAFGDGHLRIRWPAAQRAPAPAPAPATAQPAHICEGLGFRAASWDPGIAFHRLAGFQPLQTPSSRYFPAGVLPVPGFGPVGVLRIGLFSESNFPDLCEEAARRLRVPAQGPCDDNCGGSVVGETASLLTRQLELQVDALRARGIRALVVDITDNGGGSSWVAPVARTLTSVRLREPRQGYIRHEHWVRQMESRVEEVERDLARVAPRHRPLIERAAAAFRNARRAAATPCARDGIWTGTRPACSLVSDEGPLYGGGAFPYMSIEETPANIQCCYLFGPHSYRYNEGFYSGPLLVLVDRGTGSSAEYFTALLQDNRAGLIVGEPTYGAGCGYTNGGIPTTLTHSRGEVRMPDCVRYRRDGTNEVEGVTPDILVPWRENDSELQRARRIETVLPEALQRPR